MSVGITIDSYVVNGVRIPINSVDDLRDLVHLLRFRLCKICGDIKHIEAFVGYSRTCKRCKSYYVSRRYREKINPNPRQRRRTVHGSLVDKP